MEDLALPKWPVLLPASQDFEPHFHLFSSLHDRGHGLWLTEAGYHRHTRPAASRGRVRQDWTFLFNVSGRGYLELGGRRDAMRPGQALILRPRRLHTYGCESRWSSAFVHFDGPRAALLTQSVMTTDWPLVWFRRPAAAWKLVCRMLTECSRRKVRLQPVAGSILDELLIMMVDDWEAGPSAGGQGGSEFISTMHGWFLERLAQRLPLASIAAKAGFSPWHFSRVWKAQTGHAPMEYLTALRVQRARELLVQSHDRIGSIAGQVGFNDHLYFSRVFKATTGQTPSEYRRQAMATL